MFLNPLWNYQLVFKNPNPCLATQPNASSNLLADWVRWLASCQDWKFKSRIGIGRVSMYIWEAHTTRNPKYPAPWYALMMHHTREYTRCTRIAHDAPMSNWSNARFDFASYPVADSRDCSRRRRYLLGARAFRFRDGWFLGYVFVLVFQCPITRQN